MSEVVPVLEWGERILFAGRTEDFPWEMYYWDTVTRTFKPLAIAIDDHVRFKLVLAEGGAPVLDLDSVAPTTAGSVVTIAVRGTLDTVPASGTVRFAQGDTANLEARKYQGCELALVDNSETLPADAIKTFGRGTIWLKASPGGDIGIT